MSRTLAGAAVLIVVSAGLLSTCGGNNPPPPPTTFSGSYALTAAQCDGGATPPSFVPWITGGRSMKFEYPDAGLSINSVSDATCTVSLTYHLTYPTAGTMTTQGFGLSTCSPNPTACASMEAAIGGGCSTPINTDVNTWSYTAIPTGAGGTVKLTAKAGPAATGCSSEGLTDPYSFTLTKL